MGTRPDTLSFGLGEALTAARRALLIQLLDSMSDAQRAMWASIYHPRHHSETPEGVIALIAQALTAESEGES